MVETESTASGPTEELLLMRSAEEAMQDVRKSFAPVFRGVIAAVLLMILVTAAVMIWVCMSGQELIEKALIARLLQILFGMVLGISCILLGVLVSWLGITASYRIGTVADGGAVSGKLALSSTSPGVLLILGGVVLIGCALFRPIDYSETYSSKNTVVQPTGGNVGK